jgi:YVTN family beta-propeller protein
MGTPLEFRILGSLQALVDGREVPLGGARQRAVLAILLLHRGEVVSVDRIVDELWGERPPDTATKTVQVYVSRLRKALGDGVLVTRGGGYALEVREDQVDADRFARLAGEGSEALDRGDAPGAAETLEAALDLWRGPPLADFAYESFAQNEIGRLAELRLVVLEDRIEAGLALGRHAALIPELEKLVREHPARERLRGQLMLALYRSGRQSDALEGYRDAQRTLLEEFGLEPGAQLKELQRAILTQDPAIAAPPPTGVASALRQRWRGGALVALGGSLLLVAAVAAIVVAGGGDYSGTELASANSLAVIDPESDRLLATVPTGVDPIAVSADADHVWIGNRGDDTATQVDPKTMTVLSTTSAGTNVGGLAAGAGAVWIADSRGSKLVRIDPSLQSRRAIALAPRPEVFSTSTTPNPVAVGRGAVWVGRSSGGLARVDPQSGDVVAKVPVGNSPSSIATGLGGVWIADDVDNTVSRIDPASANAVTATVPVGQGPAAVAAGEGAVWVANAQDDTVSRIDPRTAAVTETIPVGRHPTGIAAGGGAVWVANSLDSTVSRIDPETNRVEATAEVGEAPQGVTVAHHLVWVSVRAAAIPPETPASASAENAARLLIPEEPSTDPALTGLADFQRSGATCALLYNYPDRPFPEGARLQPEVANGPPSVSEHGKTYTFTIRSGFRFSPPSNERVSAAAFERAIERALSPGLRSNGGALVGDIVGAQKYGTGKTQDLAGVTARGDSLTVELTKPSTNLVERLSTPWFCAVPPDTAIGHEVDSLPSAGPYYIASHVPDRSLVLRRNPNYEGERPHELTEIRYEIGVPPQRGVEEVAAGRADYVALDPLVETVTPTPPEVFRRLTTRYGPRSGAARAGRQQLFTVPALSLYYFLFNRSHGPFADLKLRRAVAYAIDRRALAAHTGLGQRGRPTDQLIPPGVPGFADVAIYPLGGPDLARARELAGAKRRRAVLYTCDFPDCTRHAQILQANLRAIGIDLDVRQFPLGEFFVRIQKPDEPWDLAYWNWFFDYPDPSNFIDDQFGPRGQTPAAVRDPATSKAIARAARLSGDARLNAYARLDRDLAERVVPAVPFASGTTTHFLSARMGCAVLHPIYSLDLAALCVRPDVDAE